MADVGCEQYTLRTARISRAQHSLATDDFWYLAQGSTSSTDDFFDLCRDPVWGGGRGTLLVAKIMKQTVFLGAEAQSKTVTDLFRDSVNFELKEEVP